MLATVIFKGSSGSTGTSLVTKYSSFSVSSTVPSVKEFSIISPTKLSSFNSELTEVLIGDVVFILTAACTTGSLALLRLLLTVSVLLKSEDKTNSSESLLPNNTVEILLAAPFTLATTFLSAEVGLLTRLQRNKIPSTGVLPRTSLELKLEIKSISTFSSFKEGCTIWVYGKKK